MSDDETACANLTQVIVLDLADSFVLGWKQVVLMELDRMRATMPYADTLTLTLTCVREGE